MSKVDTAFNFIFSSLKEESIEPIPIKEFFEDLKQNPLPNIRNVFNTFYDMIKYYVGEGKDEYPDDPESINFIDYNFDRLFVDGSDTAFFADRLFANRLMKLAESMEHGAQQNKIYVFKGPHGCGKSTFLNNLLKRFERFSNSKEGRRYEIVWRLDKTLLNAKDNLSCPMPFNIENPWQYLSSERENECSMNDLSTVVSNSKYVEIPCPSHDHPILMIPKQLRKDFIENIFGKNIFKDKKFEWIFKWKPCTVCSSIYKSLSARVSPEELFSMLYVRPYEFDRRIGNGITVFNPGDKPIKQNIITNIQLQKILNVLLGNDAVKFLHSRNVKTNNGIYALMDVKGHNVERFIDLHNIISDGVQKVEDIEEHISSLFIAVMNPEDNDNIKSIKSFEDRIEEIKIPYVLDFKTEIEIYKNTFGEEIENSFLPGVLKNFARIIVASRLNKNSDTLNAWIRDPTKYELYCDPYFHLLKMEVYIGNIPSWLSEEDRKSFTAKVRRKLISESEQEGDKGFSGRDSIRIFESFFSIYKTDKKFINMMMLYNFFTKIKKELSSELPAKFLDYLLQMYNYNILQEVKEALYYYNENKISKDIQNYLFALNFDIGDIRICNFTNERLEITEKYLEDIESNITKEIANIERFRESINKEYTSKTLTQEMRLEGKHITKTELYENLFSRYIFNLKKKVLDPFIKNENFRNAVKDVGTSNFEVYDKKIKNDIKFMIGNLIKKFGYTEDSAKEICIYVIDNDLVKQFDED